MAIYIYKLQTFYPNTVQESSISDKTTPKSSAAVDAATLTWQQSSSH